MASWYEIEETATSCRETATSCRETATSCNTENTACVITISFDNAVFLCKNKQFLTTIFYIHVLITIIKNIVF